MILTLSAHRTYKKAILAVADVTTLRVIQDHAEDLRIVWETMHRRPRLKA